MNNRSTWLPALMIVVIGLLAIIAMSSGRSNAPEVAGDGAYPHYVCTFNTYCEGDTCERNIARSVVVYVAHEDGHPRLEIPRMSPRATKTEIPEGLAFESRGGAVEGTLSVFRDGGLDFVGSSVNGSGLVEHYASGRCEALNTP